MKLGIVDVGGGFRGIYAAGVLDYCMDQQIRFDLGIGVSAGSANLASYAAGQRGRNYRFYTEYAFRKEYMGICNLVSKGFFVDMEYVFGTLSRAAGELPMDYSAFQDNPMELIMVAAAAEKLRQRARRYNESVALAQDYARQGKALIVAPDDTCGVDTLKKDKASLKQLYKKGYGDGQKISNYLYSGSAEADGSP